MELDLTYEGGWGTVVVDSTGEGSEICRVNSPPVVPFRRDRGGNNA